MRDIDNISATEIWDRIDSWDMYHRDLVSWLFDSANTDLSMTEWAEQFAHFEIAAEINRENTIWDRPLPGKEVVDLADFRDS